MVEKMLAAAVFLLVFPVFCIAGQTAEERLRDLERRAEALKERDRLERVPMARRATAFEAARHWAADLDAEGGDSYRAVTEGACFSAEDAEEFLSRVQTLPEAEAAERIEWMIARYFMAIDREVASLRDLEQAVRAGVEAQGVEWPQGVSIEDIIRVARPLQVAALAGAEGAALLLPMMELAMASDGFNFRRGVPIPDENPTPDYYLRLKYCD